MAAGPCPKIMVGSRAWHHLGSWLRPERRPTNTINDPSLVATGTARAVMMTVASAAMAEKAMDDMATVLRRNVDIVCPSI